MGLILRIFKLERAASKTEMRVSVSMNQRTSKVLTIY